MRRILPLVIGAALVMVGWRNYHHYTAARLAEAEGFSGEPAAAPAVEPGAAPAVEPSVERASTYQCDGRVYCSQMTSCEEATWFLQHCPGTKMDGEGRGDGVPCERQWCGHH
jgi:hypothetical protein